MNYLDELFNVTVDYNQDSAGNVLTTITRKDFKQAVTEALEKQKKDLLIAIQRGSASHTSVHLSKGQLVEIFDNYKLEEQENE